MIKFILSIVLIFGSLYVLYAQTNNETKSSFDVLVEECYTEMNYKNGVLYANLIMKTLNGIIVHMSKYKHDSKEFEEGGLYFFYIVKRECPVAYSKYNDSK